MSITEMLIPKQKRTLFVSGQRKPSSYKLRRDKRIKSIHSSLTIEQNTLTVEQVNDVIDGKQSAAGLAEIVGASQRTVQRALKRLMYDGKIEHVGSNRFGHYVIK